MGDRSGGIAYFRSLSGACAGRHAGPVPLCDSRLSLRQRQRVHQPDRLQAAEQTDDRTDKKPSTALHRQRIGGDQERRRHPQTYGLGIPRCAQAEPIQQFYTTHLNPYLNYHRPCAQADVEIDSKGRKNRRYRRYQTPLETMPKLQKPQQYLRSGLTVATLQRIAKTMSDTEAAQRMQQAKRKLFAQVKTAS